MLERIITAVCILLCAVPFFIISVYNKNSITPIAFFSGSEKELKKSVRDIKAYNLEMASLYKWCAIFMFAAAVGALVHPILGMAMLLAECTLGLWIVYKQYKKILNKYS